MKHLRLLLCIVVLAALAGCDSTDNAQPTTTTTIGGQTSNTPTSIAGGVPGNSPDPSPNDTNSPPVPGISATGTPTGISQINILTPTVQPSDALTATIAAQLQATAIVGVVPTSTPDANGMSPFAGIDGISVLRLRNVPVNGEYWLAYSTGSRRLDEVTQNHFVIAFQRSNDSWQEVSRLELDNPDYMSEGSIMQADIEPSHSWLSIESGVGAHGGCFDLLSFDGRALKNEVSGCASSPGAGSVEDLDGDGKGEVLLNATDNYVFCYACGVKRINYSVLHWDGARLSTLKARELPEESPADLKQINDRAVTLFTHELMKDALVKINEARSLAPNNTTVKWNQVLIKLHADARQAHVKESGYPLLTNIFYGDYPAAVDVLRDYTIDQVMSRADQSPLIEGTPAEDNADLLGSYITSTAGLALDVEPDLASAYYLRGWAYYLVGGHDDEALIDIEKAATLDPKDTLFAESLARLRP